MTITEINHPVKIEIYDREDAIISRICTADQSYPLACAANDINVDTDYPYEIERFNKQSSLHALLPGASDATKSDYVFTAIIPLEFVRSFFEKTGLVSPTQ